MQIQIDIEFDQLVQLAKKLSASQWKRLKEKVEIKERKMIERERFKDLLLNGPTFSEKQLKDINKNRKAINQWRID